jgi:hypothetical protein
LAYLVTDGLAATEKSAGLGYRVDCRGACEPSVRLDLDGAESGSAPVFAHDWMFVVTRSPNRLLAFRSSCTGACRPTAVAPLSRAGRGPFVAPGSVLVAAGSRLTAYPLAPGAHGWDPLWGWDAPFRIEDVRVRGQVAIVSGHNRAIELDLAIVD